MQADENAAFRKFKAIRRIIIIINLSAAIAAAAFILILAS